MTRPARSEHIVQFYEEGEFLLNEVSRFLSEGLRAGGAGVVIARQEHRAALEEQLKAFGLDVAGARESGRYIALDAAETLSRVIAGKRPEENRFSEIIGGVLAGALENGGSGPVRVFGEMVALLWAEGNREAATRLEQLWNDLGKVYPFSLFCAYPMGGFGSEVHFTPFREICAEHSRVIPAESYSKLTEPDERLREIAQLQQKANSLEEEVARRRRAEEELQSRLQELAAADRHKDEFLAMLGHELRNPLSPIVTALQLARLRENDREAVVRSLDVIDRQTQRLTRLVDDLLDVARITHGKIEMREETVTLTAIVEQAVEQARPLIEERGHRLVTDLPGESLWIRGDPARLEQVLANLLNNAAKYTEIGGRIAISARCDATDVVITIRDNGIGLPPELRERVFDLFVQNPESLARAPGGLGIGLTLVRRLVELHGGTVEALSDGRGRGSEFVVRLPRRTAPLPPAIRSGSGEQKPSASSSGRRVLVVDDSGDVAEGLAELLSELGHHVRTARDGAAAIQEAIRFLPEVVFLDIAMPEMDGHEVVRRLRAEVGLRSPLFVAMTGYGQERDRQLSREAGFDYHLTKPLHLGKLEHLLKRSS